jgi:hypothetical protein
MISLNIRIIVNITISGTNYIRADRLAIHRIGMALTRVEKG